MKLSTKHFGEIEVDEKGIVSFSEGLPGFKEARQYVILAANEQDSPFRWLQSIDDGNLAFAIVNPFDIKKDYEIDIDDDTVNSLGIEEPQEVTVFSIVVVPEEISKMTMNLKAPVIINTRTGKGRQIVLDTDRYSVRHYILDELRKQEVSGNAGIDTEERAVCSNK